MAIDAGKVDVADHAAAGTEHHTVKDYVATGGVKPFKSPERRSPLSNAKRQRGILMHFIRSSFGIGRLQQLPSVRTGWTTY